MVHRSNHFQKSHHRRAKQSRKRGLSLTGRRHRSGEAKRQGPFVPPEDWHEPGTEADQYQILEQPPGAGFRHILTAAEVHDRLATLPSYLLQPLEVVQLSTMTRKKRTFPCYGMQWGCAIYLYPIEESLVEYFHRPPTPKEVNETRMFGGRWYQQQGSWLLAWSEKTIRDFYLNGVLIHELGHLLDDRNRAHNDRERFADWFAIEHGYRPSRSAPKRPRIRRRHHR